jgi:hypothetical protein
MTSIASSLVGTVSTETIDTPVVANHTLVLANTEYMIALPVGSKTFALQNRNDGQIKLKTTPAGAHLTLFPGQPYYISNIKGSASVTIYVESPKAAQVLEIIAWS